MMLESYLEEHRNKRGYVPSKYKFQALLLYFHLRDALYVGYRSRHFKGREMPSKYQTTPPKFSDFPLDTNHVARASLYGSQHGFIMSDTSSGSAHRWILTEAGLRLAETLAQSVMEC